MDLKAILSHATALPVEYRRTLIDELERTFPEDYEFDESDLAEWRRRSAELEKNPGIGLTWEQVKAGLKLPKT